MPFFTSLVNFTDNIAREPARAKGLLVFPIAPWFIVAAHKNFATIGVAGSLSLIALGFVTWRLCVVTKQQAAESDEAYDREGKYKLSSEFYRGRQAEAS